MRSYIKKVIVNDANSTPEARAERVKRVRNMANLSRKDICKDKTLNINTYKGWELGRYGGLPLDGAEKIVMRVSKEGVVCSNEWLLYGIGPPPYIIADFSTLQKAEKKGSIAPTITQNKQEKLIIDEIILFRNHFKDIIYFIIEDDSMSPFYKPGEYVAGINRYGKKINGIIGLDCIVKTSDGKILLRTLRSGSKEGVFNLVYVNLQSNIKEPVLYDVVLLSAAPVTRHFRKDPNV